MTTTVTPVTVQVEAACADPLAAWIDIEDAAVVVRYSGGDILTAEHHDGYIDGIRWTLPTGVNLPSSSRSTLIGRVQQAVLVAAAYARD
ncbi:hypothetical protein [Glycomyces buryatensis]|uniref:Uncharacterized protein n=1 Tax=Glycomyces buryatensis TaxID=2570927 RepID=A0A4S8QGF3_9ACTN|nr:hypothetical protein [Glycomyces buryatensis]THV43460.1 hypothetical protein FAB82_00955 [Glycomyces buryatensis]